MSESSHSHELTPDAAVTTTPVAVVAGINDVAQESAVMAAAWDLPGAAIVRVALDVEAGFVRTIVSDFTGVVMDEKVDLEHACLSCAMREGLLPLLVHLHELGRWDAFLVSLPSSAEPMPIALGIANAVIEDKPVSESLHLASLAAVVTAPMIDEAVYGDIPLAEHGLSADDARSYAEAFTAQIEIADVLVLAASYTDGELELLNHLRRPESVVVDGISQLCGTALVTGPRDAYEVCSCVDPRMRTASGAQDSGGVVTRVLNSWKAMHPERLAASWEELSAGDLRGRGAFWVPGRPHLAVAWDCAGGRLAMGAVGGWHDVERHSRWIVTGSPQDVERAARAFDRALMSDAEMVAAQQVWTGRPDGLEEWLGEIDEAA